MRRLHARSAILALLFAGPVACVPYAVGSTAQPVPVGESRGQLTAYRIPNGVDMYDESTDEENADFAGIDLERRVGVADGLDIGVRAPSLSGVVVTAKRRLAGGSSHDDAALSIMPGLGLVNWMSHAHGELTLMASASRRWGMTPYGGLRVMQVVPLDSDAAHDSPTAGGYLGLRFGIDEGAVIPEIGIYHDRSALELRRSSVIVVPSITIEGDLFPTRRLGRMLRGLRGWR